MFLWVEHLDTHVDYPSRRKVLPLFALGRLVDKVFKCIIYHVEIGIEQLPFFEGTDTNLQMVWGKPNTFIVKKDAGPLVLGAVK